MANADFVTRITLQNQEFQNEIKECKKEISKLKGAASDSSAGIGSLVSSFGKFAGISIGVGAVASGMLSVAKSSIEAYSKIEDLRISFQTMLGSATQAESLLSSIREYGANTPYDTEGLAKAAQTMLSYGMAASDIMPTIKQLGDIGMGSSQKLQSLSLAFAQMSASGKVMKQDLNQMINAGFNPLQTISEKTGESMGVLLDKVSKGQISINQIKDAFKDATSEGGQFYNMMNNMNGTISGAVGSLGDSLDGLKQAVGELIAPAVVAGINALADAFNALADALKEVQRWKKISQGGWEGYGKDQQDKFDRRTQQMLADIAKDPKKRDKYIKQTQAQLDTAEHNKAVYNANLNYWLPKSDKEKTRRTTTGRTGATVVVESKKGLEKTEADISNLQDRLAQLRGTQPEITTTTTSTTTSTTKTNNTKKEVAPEGSIARLNQQLQKAQHDYDYAATDAGRAVAQAIIDEIKHKIEEAQNIDYNALNQQIAEKKYKNEGNKGSIPAAGFELEEFSGVLDVDAISQIQENIDQITLDVFTSQMEEAREAAENMEAALWALGSVNIESMDSIINAFEGIGNITNQTAKGLATAGSAAIMMGQALQTLGSQGAAAKAGLILSALGQIAVSFATALADAGKQSWITWLAFGISGMATMMSLISQIKSFSDGGILNGINTHGDQMLARVNAGEMILNGSQQRNLFNMLNNKGAVGNTLSGDVEFVISGSNLKGVLRNYDKKMSIL
jgi:tape measure domain-containing protein